MRIYDIIIKKRDKKELTREEIDFFVKNYVSGEIKDYQAAALLMAIFINGMNDSETSNLTISMANSGKILDLSEIPGIKVDKHSTGGVGDKTTPIVLSIVASLGVTCAKMSGRGLGYTGGTIDKLESIPGFKTSFKKEEFINIVKNTGLSIVGQTENLAPADKLLYSLRDVTATVDSISLIASSVMSKKIAAGADKILLDVKFGSGAFMKTAEKAVELAQKMVNIGKKNNKKTVALVTNMDCPLGKNIGNSLEIIEICEVLKKQEPKDLTEISIELASNMLYLAKFNSNIQECKKAAIKVLFNGSAFNKFKELVKAQGGDVSVLENYSKFKQAKIKYEIFSNESGFIYSMNTEKIGISSMILGSGRKNKEDKINNAAGIVLNKKTGDYINSGDKIAEFYTDDINSCKRAEKVFLESLDIKNNKPENFKLIYKKLQEI